ncbi:antibiotic biosynthesis monooxygenase family protein [Lederbergia graminis]|uniref:Antibiotic biosynthesis monooxygenase family protein n=1 Tax=Lederbergia graminis TaxID=735518 RepID=A0ABW0LGK1_9BACI|nr:antibiotic biosynthesis monooxygenase [Paenibacillus bovis]
MFFYITSGTYSFLEKIKEKYSKENMVLMHNLNNAQLIHETPKKSLFQSPRKYTVIDSAGEFTNKGFISCIYIPVRDEDRPVFEYRIENRAQIISREDGFLALRVLRPLKQDTYIVMSMWSNKEAYEKWIESPSFKQSQYKSNATNVFSGPSYTTTYQVGKEEDEEN